MSETRPDITAEPTTGDPLARVHHHSFMVYREARLAGIPVPTVCGIVKRHNPDARSLPCCPLCAHILAERGTACQVWS